MSVPTHRKTKSGRRTMYGKRAITIPVNLDLGRARSSWELLIDDLMVTMTSIKDGILTGLGVTKAPPIQDGGQATVSQGSLARYCTGISARIRKLFGLI